ncbi:MAG TPA: hypothetical protein ENJ37_03870 [Deltaproteobacteria bacterium]|nr:hypothetical protein [Deltaproteobacteria bacterium]
MERLMSLVESTRKKGYIPLAGDGMVCLGWRGEELEDFWMWNGRFIEYEGGGRRIRTVRVRELKEAALRYWLDGWVPVAAVDEALLRRMEAALRSHRGLARRGVRVPAGAFLSMPEPIPREYIEGPDGRARQLRSVPESALEAFRRELAQRSSGRAMEEES